MRQPVAERRVDPRPLSHLQEPDPALGHVEARRDHRLAPVDETADLVPAEADGEPARGSIEEHIWRDALTALLRGFAGLPRTTCSGPGATTS